MRTYCKGVSLTRQSVADAMGEWLRHGSGRKNRHRLGPEYGGADALVDEIWRELSSRTLSFEPIRTHERHDPNSGKLRRISVESVKRQVCSYLCVAALEPLLSARVGFWQVSCGVPGKGSAMGMRKLRREARRHRYFAHVDVRDCYGSMRTDAVEALVARHVRNPQVLYLLHALLSTMGGSLVLGSYLSLRLAALALSEAYHAVEGAAYQRRGRRVPLVACQVWYADDGYLLGDSKKAIRRAVGLVSRALGALGLSLSPWKVCRTGAEPVDFAGYRVWHGRSDLRKGLWRRLRRAFSRFGRRRTRRLARRACSYWGWLTTARMERQWVARHRVFNAARAAAS